MQDALDCRTNSRLRTLKYRIPHSINSRQYSPQLFASLIWLELDVGYSTLIVLLEDL